MNPGKIFSGLALVRPEVCLDRFPFKIIFLLIILFLAPLATTFGQSKTLKQLKEEEKVWRRGFYFYPSTLRMININKNEEYYEMIKDIKKLVFFRMDREKFGSDDFYQTISDLESVEAYAEYMVVEGADQQLYIYGKKSPTQTVVLASMKGDYFIVEILGKIDLLEIPKLYNKLSNEEAGLGEDFIDIFSIMGLGNDKGKPEEKETEPEDEAENNAQNTNN